jgi:signal peptidase I
MNKNYWKAAAWILGAIAVMGIWLSFGPERLGGSATYSITSGTSMEPLIHKNALALVRAQPSYKVGDVVLYNSSVLHKPVLHRIIHIQNGDYFFKGDNNDFVDPGYATKSELIGKLWIHVPAAGGILGWFGKPVQATLLSMALVVILFVTGMSTVSYSRRRRGKRAVHHAAAGEMPSFLGGAPISLVIFGVLLGLTFLLYVIGFSRPGWHTAPLPNAYKQAGEFTYTGPVNAPTAVYPGGTVKTGEPLYPGLLDSVTLRFRYRFDSNLPHDIKGTIEMKALLLAKSDTWQDLSLLVPPTRFDGDHAFADSTIMLSNLYALIDQVTAQSGSSAYSADIQPTVHITGTVNGKHIDDRFVPVIPFTIGRNVITLNTTAATPAPTGATYVPPSSSANKSLILNPHQFGSIPQLADNIVSIGKYQFTVPNIRRDAYVLTVLTVAAGIAHNVLRRRERVKTTDDLIAEQYESFIVPVSSLAVPDGSTVTELKTFKELAELAKYLERPILTESEAGAIRTYVVDDGEVRYTAHSANVSRKPRTGQTLFAVSPKAAGIYQRAWGTMFGRITIAVIVLTVAATLATSLTASNTVPATKVGTSQNARTIAQLTPSKCSTLTLTSLVFKTAGNSSNTTSNALIIGTSGVETLNDTGNNNCIVGGAGKDAITAKATSICVIGPTSGATYTTCTKK